jgi:hypothetical protein
MEQWPGILLSKFEMAKAAFDASTDGGVQPLPVDSFENTGTHPDRLLNFSAVLPPATD